MASKASPREFDQLPSHVAIVPDGNGRWAEKQGWPRLVGHREGAKNMYRMMRYMDDYPEIKYLTLYSFSSENWIRPTEEVSGLFGLHDLWALAALPASTGLNEAQRKQAESLLRPVAEAWSAARSMQVQRVFQDQISGSLTRASGCVVVSAQDLLRRVESSLAECRKAGV